MKFCVAKKVNSEKSAWGGWLKRRLEPSSLDWIFTPIYLFSLESGAKGREELELGCSRRIDC